MEREFQQFRSDTLDILYGVLTHCRVRCSFNYFIIMLPCPGPGDNTVPRPRPAQPGTHRIEEGRIDKVALPVDKCSE